MLLVIGGLVVIAVLAVIRTVLLRCAAGGDYETRQGDILLTDRRWDAALERFEAALGDLAGASWRAGWARRSPSLQSGRTAEAEAAFTHVIERLGPKIAADDATGRAVLAGAYANRGILHDREGRFAAALADYRQALAVDAEAVEGPGLLDRVLYRQRPPVDGSEACRLYRMAAGAAGERAPAARPRTRRPPTHVQALSRLPGTRRQAGRWWRTGSPAIVKLPGRPFKRRRSGMAGRCGRGRAGRGRRRSRERPRSPRARRRGRERRRRARQPLRQPAGDGRGERAAGAVGVPRVDAGALEALGRPAALGQHVDQDSGPSPCPPFSSTARGPRASSRAASLLPAAGPRDALVAEQRLRLRQIGRQHRRHRQQQSPQACRPPRPPAATGRPSPPSPDRRRRGCPGAASASTAATVSTISGRCSMPSLMQSAPMSSSTTRICWRDERPAERRRCRRRRACSAPSAR